MEELKLKVLMLEKKMKVDDVLYKMKTEEGVEISRSAFYRKMKGSTEFTRKELKALANVLEMNNSQIMSIFFNEKVS